MAESSAKKVQQSISDNKLSEAQGQTQPKSAQQKCQENQRIKIYHERQSRQLCALHALNNLFQSPRAFSKQDLDAICKELSPGSWIFNPHRLIFGLGCYDVNVVIAALSKKGFEVKWFDKRKEVSCLNMDNIFGLILNVPNTSPNSLFSLPLSYIPIQAQIWSSQKHWIAIKKIGSSFYNLDSKLISPHFIGDDEALFQYLKFKSSVEPIELLVVVHKNISDNDGWMKKDSRSPE